MPFHWSFLVLGSDGCIVMIQQRHDTVSYQCQSVPARLQGQEPFLPTRSILHPGAMHLEQNQVVAGHEILCALNCRKSMRSSAARHKQCTNKHGNDIAMGIESVLGPCWVGTLCSKKSPLPHMVSPSWNPTIPHHRLAPHVRRGSHISNWSARLQFQAGCGGSSCRISKKNGPC